MRGGIVQGSRLLSEELPSGNEEKTILVFSKPGAWAGKSDLFFSWGWGKRLLRMWKKADLKSGD